MPQFPKNLSNFLKEIIREKDKLSIWRENRKLP